MTHTSMQKKLTIVCVQVTSNGRLIVVDWEFARICFWERNAAPKQEGELELAQVAKEYKSFIFLSLRFWEVLDPKH